jgi:hypothetical protein
LDALPVELNTELVMAAALLDRHAVTTHRFRAAERPEVLADAMRERWRTEGRTFVESRHADWTLLSVREPQGVRTVQLRAAPWGTEGLASSWVPANGEGAERIHTVSVPPVLRWLSDDARVIRHLSHRDTGRDGATVVAVLPATPQIAATRLRERASAEGYGADPGLGLPAGRAAWYRGGGASGEALAFRRGREEVVATVAPHPEGAAVVLHWGMAR